MSDNQYTIPITAAFMHSAANTLAAAIAQVGEPLPADIQEWLTMQIEAAKQVVEMIAQISTIEVKYSWCALAPHGAVDQSSGMAKSGWAASRQEATAMVERYLSEWHPGASFEWNEQGDVFYVDPRYRHNNVSNGWVNRVLFVNGIMGDRY